MKKRILSILLTLCMVLMLCPVTVFADEHVYRVAGQSGLCGSSWDATDDNNRMTYNEETGRFEKVYTDVAANPITGYEYKIVVDGVTWIPDGLGSNQAVYVDDDNATVTIWYDEETGEWGADVAYDTPAEPTLAITVEGFEVGNTPADCTVTFDSTIPGVEFSEDDIVSVDWLYFDGMIHTWSEMGNTEVFEAGTRYKIYITMDNKGLTEAPAVTVNGNTPESCRIATRDGVPIRLQILYDFGTPAPAPAITINGPDVVCAQQDYEFSVTPAKGVLVEPEFEYSYDGFLTYDSGSLNILDGVIPAEKYDLDQSSFELRVRGELADEMDVKTIKTVQISKEHIFVDGVCACGAKPEYTITYDGGEGVGGSIPADTKTHGVPVTLSSDTFIWDGFVQTGWVDKETGAIYDLGATYDEDRDATLYPYWEKLITVTAPFTTTVALGDAGEPGETTFMLGLIDGTGNELTYDDQYFFAEITTDGAGSYSGEVTITATAKWLYDMLYEGAFIWQYDGEEEGWTYDDTVWGVRLYMPEIAARSVSEPEYSLLIYPTYVMDNGLFNLDLDADPVDEMTFTNTYTKNTTLPEDEETTEIPNTGDSSNLALWFALLAVSAAGVIVMVVYSRRKGNCKTK